MLSNELLIKLNKQVALEAYSAHLYLQMSSWCNSKSLPGCAQFFYNHAEEERVHMTKLFNYINDTGAFAEVSSVEAPPKEFSGILQLFESTLEHERSITNSINQLVDISLTQKDFSTFNFLQWYVAEQHEEEKLFNAVIDKIKIIGTEGHALFHIDNEVLRISKGNGN